MGARACMRQTEGTGCTAADTREVGDARPAVVVSVAVDDSHSTPGCLGHMRPRNRGAAKRCKLVPSFGTGIPNQLHVKVAARAACLTAGRGAQVDGAHEGRGAEQHGLAV